MQIISEMKNGSRAAGHIVVFIIYNTLDVFMCNQHEIMVNASKYLCLNFSLIPQYSLGNFF